MNATITAHFGFVFAGKPVQGNRIIKSFPATRKQKAGVFKFLRFEERFRKTPFSRQISVDVRPSRRNKDAFSNFSGVVWTLPWIEKEKN